MGHAPNGEEAHHRACDHMLSPPPGQGRGAGPQRTEQAARIFADRYLDGFLDAALASVHPMA